MNSSVNDSINATSNVNDSMNTNLANNNNDVLSGFGTNFNNNVVAGNRGPWRIADDRRLYFIEENSKGKLNFDSLGGFSGGIGSLTDANNRAGTPRPSNFGKLGGGNGGIGSLTDANNMEGTPRPSKDNRVLIRSMQLRAALINNSQIQVRGVVDAERTRREQEAARVYEAAMTTIASDFQQVGGAGITF